MAKTIAVTIADGTERVFIGRRTRAFTAPGAQAGVSDTDVILTLFLPALLFVNVQANTIMNMQMDFDLMDSLQSNMSMNPTMTSMMPQTMPGSNMFDEMDDMLGQVNSVSTANNQFTMSFVQGMPSMTLAADTNTTFEDFDSIRKPNSIAGLAQGQIVLVKMGLMAGGTLHAEKVCFESTQPGLGRNDRRDK